MQIDVSFNPIEMKRLQRQLETTYKATGITVQYLCNDQMQLACKDAIKFSPPWAAGKPGTGTAQRKTGEGAAEKDIERAFARIEDVVVFVSSNGKTMARSKKTGVVYEIDAALVNPNIESLHRKLRNRKGRVPRQARQALVKGKELVQYIKATSAHVGKLKASWIPALTHYASRTGASVKLPAWIRRHAGSGTYSGTISNDGKGSITATSTAPNNIAIRPGIITWIQNNRQRQMKKYSEKRMQQIADQFNANRAAIMPIRGATT